MLSTFSYRLPMNVITLLHQRRIVWEFDDVLLIIDETLLKRIEYPKARLVSLRGEKKKKPRLVLFPYSSSCCGDRCGGS